MEQRAKWKEKVMHLFFEEEEIEREPNTFVLELAGWKAILVTITLISLISMTVFSYMYIFKTARAVEALCTTPFQQMGVAARGGMFEVGTSKGPMLVILEPVATESMTHRHLKCTIPNFH